MAAKPKPDSRAKALAAMTKAELVKTIKALDARQTKLLNQVARLQKIADDATALVKAWDAERYGVTIEAPSQFFPWSATNQEPK